MIVQVQDIKQTIGVVELGNNMKHFIYKITNTINGKYYMGRHSTTNINDDYMGSGIGIKNAILKYGIENFKKEIIAEVNTSDELWELEKEMVNDAIVKDKMSYNVAYGGKHYLHGLKQYDNSAFIQHQSNAGKIGGISFYKKFGKEWNRMGGSVSSKKRSSEYIYKVQTNTNEVFLLNGLEFKEKCNEMGWNYNTLHWKQSQGKEIKKGKHKGFRVDLIQSPK